MKFYCIKQHDITDCGAACLATILKQYGSNVSISKIREVAGTDIKGTNLLGIITAANALGLDAKAVKGTKEALFSNFKLPAIAHVVVNNGTLLHYVVVHKITKKYVIIADPAVGIKKLKIDEFCNIWTGYIVMLSPSDTFVKTVKDSNKFEMFLRLLYPQRKLVFDIFLASIMITILGIFGAFYFQLVIDEVLSSNIKETLFTISIGVIILNIFSIFLTFIRSMLLVYFTQKLDISLLLGYYNHVIELPMNFFQSRRIGEIISRFQDSTIIREAISKATLTMMIDVIMAVVGGVILFLKSKILFFITVIMALLYCVLVIIFNGIYKKLNMEQMENNSKLTSYLIESLQGILTIKSFNLEERTKIQTELKFVKLLKSIFNLSYIGNLQEILKYSIESIGAVIIIWVGALSVIKGEMTIGSLISFNALLAYFLTPIKNIINLQPTIQTALVATERLVEILELEVEKNDDIEKNKLELQSLYGDIKIENIFFRYGTRKYILEDFSLDIKKGEKIALVGESGAGKSTIAKILLKLYDIEKGNITISNYSISDIKIDILREKIAYISQEVFLFTGTIMENLMYGSSETTTIEEIMNISKLTRVHDFVDELPLRYNTYLEENGNNLSGGEKQRIAITRALLKKPDILILDEATSNLDTITEKAISEMIEKYTQNTTVIIIAHRLSTVKNCDKIFVLDKGQVVESGNHNELMEKNGYYSKLYNV